MKCNVAFVDRIIRFLFGTILTSWALAGGPSWAFFGVYLLFSAGWGFCLFYGILKINTIKDLKSDNTLMNPPGDGF
jgi:hypothetical protein